MKLLLSLFLVLSVYAEMVDVKKSQVTWLGEKITGKHWGKVAIKSGKLELNKGNLEGGEILMDMNNMTVDDIKDKSTASKFLGHIKSADFFEVEKFPSAKLVIKSVDKETVKADLTIKGVTQPVTFNYTKDDKVFKGDLVFDRTFLKI